MEGALQIQLDRPGEECGVFGVYSQRQEDVASLAYYGLYSLQHRGQEGCGIVVNDDGVLGGMITDGDLRRHMGPDLLDQPVTEVMTRDPKTVSPATLAADALRLMTAGSVKITQLFVLDGGKPVGLLHIHDLLRAGVK